MLFRLVLMTLIFTTLLFATESNGYKQEEIRLPRKETLYLVGFQWGAPSSFNPLNGWPSWPVRYEFNLMYEPLLNYNSMSGEIEPLLGELHKSNSEVIEVKLNPKAKWSDGKAVTAADVIFTYTLNLSNPEAPCSFIEGHINEILSRKEGCDEIITFVIDKKRNNPIEVLNHLTACPIYPKHIFEPKLQSSGGSIYNMQDDVMARPQVVSGPYNYYAHTEYKIIISRRDNYWGDAALHGGRKAAPRFIVHPIYKGNVDAQEPLKEGLLDISSNYMPNVWEMKKKLVRTWFDEAPYYRKGSIPMFIVNCQSVDKPIINARFRRAIALAINYEKINKKAISSYSVPLQSGLILPTGPESVYYDSSEVKKYGNSKYDPLAVKALLTEIGYEPKYKDGTLVGATWNGENQPAIKLTCPNGWSDWMIIINEVVNDLNAAGIYAKADFVTYPEYEEAKYRGTFDLFLEVPVALLSAGTPYTRFEKIMSSANWKPAGEKMYENTGRFNKPNSAHYIAAVDSLIAIAPLVKDKSKLKEIYTRLNRFYMQEQPTIPVSYRPEEFYTFNERYWTGFPTAKNSYAPPRMPVSGAGRKILWHIKPAPERKQWWNLKK